MKINYSDEVLSAFNEKKPLVALESTIISHGMPYPSNYETAISVSDVVRDNGAVPATIAIINGIIHIGLDNDSIKQFAEIEDVTKASTRDLAYVLNNRLSASTTVAATAHIASLAKIFFFATGGIGGVHPDLAHAYDISADLGVMAQTPITVIASGAKSILDLPKTLEHLETLSVPVVGYKTTTFPAFYSHESPYELTMKADSAADVANQFYLQQQLGLKQGMLVCNPVPKHAEIPYDEISIEIEKAIADAKGHIKGKALTPYLLKHISNTTQGRSLQTNIELIKCNAEVAAKIAVSYSKLQQST